MKNGQKNLDIRVGGPHKTKIIHAFLLDETRARGRILDRVVENEPGTVGVPGEGEEPGPGARPAQVTDALVKVRTPKA